MTTIYFNDLTDLDTEILTIEARTNKPFKFFKPYVNWTNNSIMYREDKNGIDDTDPLDRMFKYRKYWVRE